MIYQIHAIEKPTECDSCILEPDTFMTDFNKEKGYNFVNDERFSTDLVDTKFRYFSADQVVQLKIDISNFNSSYDEDKIIITELN